MDGYTLLLTVSFLGVAKTQLTAFLRSSELLAIGFWFLREKVPMGPTNRVESMSHKLSFGMAALAALLASTTHSMAAACENPDALGVSRILPLETQGGFQVGAIQYHRQKLPLAPKEVVLTFDDGPSPETTNKVLEALAAECTKATFFIVGRMAKAHPETLRKELAAGHTIGTHTYGHPLDLQHKPFEVGASEIDRGIEEVTKILGVPPAPFFRFPGLGSTKALAAKLAEANIGTLSADVVGDDWRVSVDDRVRELVLKRLDQRGGGVVLLHDIKHATASMLPQLLRDLKERGYKVVQLVPASEASQKVAEGDAVPTPVSVVTLRAVSPPNGMGSAPTIASEIAAELGLRPLPALKAKTTPHKFAPQRTTTEPINLVPGKNCNECAGARMIQH